MEESGEGAGEAGCSLAGRAPGCGGGGDHGGECDEDGVEDGFEVDYQVVPDCKLVSTIMGIHSRLQVKHLVMFQYFMLNVWILYMKIVDV